MPTAHEAALETKHRTLEARIAAERQRPGPDDRLIAELKKQKLVLKQELAAPPH